MGKRLIDEYLATKPLSQCKDFKQTMEVICKQAMKMFLGVQGEIKQWEGDKCCTLLLKDNPLADFVVLP